MVMFENYHIGTQGLDAGITCSRAYLGKLAGERRVAL